MPTHRHGTQSFIDFMQTYLRIIQSAARNVGTSPALDRSGA